MSTMPKMPREVSGHSHHASDLVAVLCHLKFGRIKKKKTYKLQVFWSFGHISLHRSTRSVGGNLFDILRNQAFSLRQRLFSGKILRSSRRKSSEQFWSPVWTAGHSSAVDKMTQMCLSVPIRLRCGPFCSRY